MAYTRTGRPPGRPKTKEYVTLMARVPKDVADQAKRYAARRQQNLSVVLRDALDLLLQEDRYPPFVSDMHRVQEIMSDINGAPEIMSDTLHTKTALGIVSDANGALESEVDGEALTAFLVRDTEALDPMPLGESVAITRQLAPSVPGYDPTRYVLGDLCIHAHDYHGIGQSLRRRAGRECLECQAARARAARERKRQAQPVSTL